MKQVQRKKFPNRYFKGCQNKKHHPSKTAALNVLDYMLGKAHQGYIPELYQDRMTSKEYVAFVRTLEPYKCKVCSRGWCLGHPNREVIVR